jgi:hypothetical protein
MKNWVRIPTDAFLESRIRTGIKRWCMGKRTLICSTVRHAHLRNLESQIMLTDMCAVGAGSSVVGWGTMLVEAGRSRVRFPMR